MTWFDGEKSTIFIVGLKDRIYWSGYGIDNVWKANIITGQKALF